MATCSNYNIFLTTWHKDSLEAVVDTVKSNGTIYFDFGKFDMKIGALSNMKPYFGLSGVYSFRFKMSGRSRLDSTKYYARYQQYYNNIIVEGGGYTVSFFPPFVPGPVGPGPVGPCDQLYSLTPYILSDINININPTIDSSQVANILSIDSLLSAELVISHNLNSNCKYNLTWKVTYIDNLFKMSVIDAHSGLILKTFDLSLNHNVPTHSYCVQDLKDFHDVNNNLVWLQSNDRRISIYDFGVCPDYVKEPWDQQLIPKINISDDWENQVSTREGQLLFVTELVDEQFSENPIDFTFDEINIATDCDVLYYPSSARVLSIGPNISKSNAYILIAHDAIDDLTYALFDIIGHELTHILLLNYDFEATGIGRLSIQEGISDIIGTYIESEIQNSNIYCVENGVDWIMGDDNSSAKAMGGNRNLKSPRYSCVTEFNDNTDQHFRGELLGHWYYTLATGYQSIYSIGMEKPIEILLDAILRLSGEREVNFYDLMLQTLNVVLDRYGRCSREFVSVARAWEHICVSVPAKYKNETGIVYSCDKLHMVNHRIVCEEEDYIKICIPLGDIIPGDEFNWRLSGSATNFRINGVPYSTPYEGARCITLTDFPNFNYYPQYIKVFVEAENIEKDRRDKIIIKIIDCDGDDCSCEEFHENPENCSGSYRLNVKNSNIKKKYLLKKRKVEYIKIYNLQGQELAHFSSDELNISKINYSGVFIICYFDKYNKVIYTEKIIKFR